MFGQLNSTGVAMLLKAMGFDPEVLAQKAQELEAMGKQAAVQLQAGVQSMDTRLSNLETSVAALHQKFDAAMGATAPAGESSPFLLEAPAPQKESQHHGRRNAPSHRANRSNRKAS